MKPFNLEQALAGAPVVNRKGRKIIQLFHATEIARCGERNNLLGVDEHGGYNWYFPEGHFHKDHSKSQEDLFMAPTKCKGYLRLYEYPSENVRLCSYVCPTREAAEQARGYRGPIVEFEWEE